MALLSPFYFKSIANILLNFSYKNDMTGYVPYGARSRDEYAVQEEFANHNGKGVLLLAVVLAKHNGTVLTPEVLQEANEVREC